MMSRSRSSVRPRVLWRSVAAVGAVVCLSGSVVVSCEGDPPVDAGSGGGGDISARPKSLAFEQWSPDPRYTNECPKALHDTYVVIGPDGKRYPTWHPPTDRTADGTPCSYGHEHGQDPRASRMWDDLRKHFAWDANNNGTIDDSEWNNSRTGIPFGYAPEQLRPNADRVHEHSAYKIQVDNGRARERLVNGSAQASSVVCNQLIAYNQDVYGADAFGSNAHELMVAIDCTSDATTNYAPKMIVSVLGRFGSAQQIGLGALDGSTAVLTNNFVPVPANSLPPETEVGSEVPSRRAIPDATRALANMLVASNATSDLNAALGERWDAVIVLKREDGSELARLNPGVETKRAPRYFDANRSNGLARSIDLCYAGLDANGTLITDPSQAGSVQRKVRGSTVDCPTPNGPAVAINDRIAFDAPASPLKGCERDVIWRHQSINNVGGREIWYTDAWGNDGRTVLRSGAVKQFIKGNTATPSTVTLAPVTVNANAPDCSAGSGVHVRRDTP